MGQKGRGSGKDRMGGAGEGTGEVGEKQERREAREGKGKKLEGEGNLAPRSFLKVGAQVS